MPIPDNTFFGAHFDGRGAILFEEVRQITDEDNKLLLLKRRLEAYLISQIDLSTSPMMQPKRSRDF